MTVQTKKRMFLIITLVGFLMGTGIIACNSTTQLDSTSDTVKLADEIVIYDWTGGSPQDVFDQFTDEYGVEIRYVEFDSQEEAIENIRAGEVYDIVLMENQYIADLVAEGLLATIDKTNIPNFKNVPASFRDLAHDPNNGHTIPYSWGTTGLLVRSDLTEEPVVEWAAMWDPRYAGRVVNWKSTPRYTLGLALMTLGYSINSENPVELQEALEYLQELEPNATWLTDESSIAPYLISGEAVLGLGFSYDYWDAIAENENITYVLPEEGTLLWGDNWVIPANSPNQYTAELFLNFFLRPEIAAEIVNYTYYAVANEKAIEFVDPELRDSDIIFPSNESMANAEFILPLSPEGLMLWDETWNRFLAGQ